MIISLIAAVARNHVIGKDNRMIWHLRKDMQRFRKLTTGHHLLMGRNTYESIGKPLGNRTNLIVSRRAGYRADGAFVFPDLRSAVDFARDRGETELFVIGGGQIYEKFLEVADRIYLTKVLAEPEGDALFPLIGKDDWKVTFEEAHAADDQHDHPFVFLDLVRRVPKNACEWWTGSPRE